MAEELRGGVCGGSWQWSRNLFTSSPCLLVGNPDADWSDHGLFVEENRRSSDDSAGSGSDGGTRPPDDWSHDLLPDGNYQQQTRLDFPAIQPIHNPGLSAGFPMNPALLQTLFDTNTDQLEQPSLLDSKAMDYSANEFLPRLPEQDPPMFGKHQISYPDWITGLSDLHGSLIPSTHPQFLPISPDINKQHNLPDFNTKRQSEESRESSSSAMKKSSNDKPILKRPRFETPSPLPTFKVRKEKLGDRITALQQLVSPFGKTDTASVLHGAFEYIKFLHDQVSVLCTPYLKKGSLQLLYQHQKDPDCMNDQEGQTQGLRNGGLCLVPISSTFAMADTSADFWTPTFAGSFKL